MPSGVVQVKLSGSAPFSSLAASAVQSFRPWSLKSTKPRPFRSAATGVDYSGRSDGKSRNAKGFGCDLHHVHEAVDGGLVHDLGIAMDGGAGVIDHGLECA